MDTGLPSRECAATHEPLISGRSHSGVRFRRSAGQPTSWLTRRLYAVARTRLDLNDDSNSAVGFDPEAIRSRRACVLPVCAHVIGPSPCPQTASRPTAESETTVHALLTARNGPKVTSLTGTRFAGEIVAMSLRHPPRRALTRSLKGSLS